jgi:hypothetical protein
MFIYNLKHVNATTRLPCMEKFLEAGATGPLHK